MSVSSSPATDKSIISILEEEAKMVKELENPNDFMKTREFFANYIKDSSNDCRYFLSLLNHLLSINTINTDLSLILLETLYFTFPDQNKEKMNDVAMHIKLKKSGKRIGQSDELYELQRLLRSDDADGLVTFLVYHPTIDVRTYYPSLIDTSCVFGSLKCFKYLLLNKCEINECTLYETIKGGNQDIVAILFQSGYSFKGCLETSVEYHRYELTNWIFENNECKPVSLPKCIQYYNFDAFLYFLKSGLSGDETFETRLKCCLLPAIEFGYFPLVVHLVEKGADLQEKNCFSKTPLEVACESNQLSIVKYLFDIDNHKNMDRCIQIACFYGNIDIVKFILSKESESDKKKQIDILFIIACEKNHFQLIPYLHEEGADINTNQGEHKWTPLHIAARYGDIKLATYLLQKGANTEIRDEMNMTPAETAKLYRNMHVFNMITDAQQTKN